MMLIMMMLKSWSSWFGRSHGAARLEDGEVAIRLEDGEMAIDETSVDPMSGVSRESSGCTTGNKSAAVMQKVEEDMIF